MGVESAENAPKVILTQEEFGILAITAVRYCMERSKVIPDLVFDTIFPHLPDFADKHLKILRNDSISQQKADKYGHAEIEKAGWKVWMAKIDAEVRIRAKNR